MTDGPRRTIALDIETGELIIPEPDESESQFRPRRPGGPLQADLACVDCETTAVLIEQEWFGDDGWERTFYCPDCGVEEAKHAPYLDYADASPEEIEEILTRTYVHSNNMSLGAFERSLDRLYGRADD